MVTSLGSVSLSLFGGTSTSTGTGVDATTLATWAANKAGIITDSIDVSGADPNAPTPPWTAGWTRSFASLQQMALGGQPFFQADKDIYADDAIGGDYRNLFAAYQGLRTMSALAERAETKNLSALDLQKTQAAFARGVTELKEFFANTDFSGINLAAGDRMDQQLSKLAIPTASANYQTGVIVKGSVTSTVPGLANDAVFNIIAKGASGVEKTVTIDLANMGSQTRSLGAIVSYANQRLAAAGVATRLEAVNTAPKTEQVKVGGQTVTRAYHGQALWTLSVKANGGETVRFSSPQTAPAFYAIGENIGGAGRLIKFEDTDDALGQSQWAARPAATSDPIGALISAGYGVPASATETKSTMLVSDGTTVAEPLLRAAGEAVIKLSFADGRTTTLTTGWRAFDQENWRTRAGETEDQSIVGDLAERLTQLLHEQGIAASAQSWIDGNDAGISFLSEDGVRIDSLQLSGKTIALSAGRDASGTYDGGLRGGVAARRYELAQNVGVVGNYAGNQTLTFSTTRGGKTVTLDAGEPGMDEATFAAAMNDKLKEAGVPARFAIYDNAGTPTLRLDTTHEITAVTAKVNGYDHTMALQAPPSGMVNGGLPVSSSGLPFGDDLRTYTNSGASPFIANSGALDIVFNVATANGAKQVAVSISAQDRIDNPDASPGVLNAALQARIDAALNAAGVYVSASGGDLGSIVVAEGTGQRLTNVTVNGGAVSYDISAPSYGVGGAFDAERSFTLAQAASASTDVIASLTTDPTVSITLDTVWGPKTISTSLQGGDARDLDTAALRLNEALAAQGYDAGVAVTALSDGGVGLRVVTGSSNSVRGVSEVSLGATDLATTLDPVDAATYSGNLTGGRVDDRASRDASILTNVSFPSSSGYASPAANGTAWFTGRSFDLQLGQGAKILAARATATGADGSVYALVDVSGALNGQPIAGKRDVALLKYDSAGQLIFARTLGAADEVQGNALAVSADGKIAIAGSVTGALQGASASSNAAAKKTDSFVTMFDADGKEIWTQRRGASADDAISEIQFASTGALVVAGVTSSSMSGTQKGGVDAYVRGFSSSGGVLFTEQYGTGGDDSVGALLVRDGGGGALSITVGGVENNRGVLRSFSYSSSSGFGAGATRDIGLFSKGGITSLAHDGTSLYVGGTAIGDRVTVGASARKSVAGLDGFVARLDDDLVSTALDRVSYIGSAQDDSVTGITVTNGAVYALGAAGGMIAGAGASKAGAAFMARLDDNGDVDWVRNFSSAGGRITPTGLAVDTGGASALDRLGLPNGTIKPDSSKLLIDRAAVRAGDEFTIASDEGAAHRVTIGASETLASLVAKINSNIRSSGSASIVRENGAERIKITARDGHTITFAPGGDGKNALLGLGLTEGVIAAKTPQRGDLRTFGLGLAQGDLSLASATAITKTKNELTAATSILSQAYQALSNPNAKDQTDEEKALATRKAAALGNAPAYLTERISNYATALIRLGG